MERLRDREGMPGSVKGGSVSQEGVSDEVESEEKTSSAAAGEVGVRRAHNESAVLWDLLHAIGDPPRPIAIYYPPPS